MKISVIGIGRVGKAIAFAIITKGLATELVLVGRTKESGIGDALDLRHASCFGRPTAVTSGSVEETTDSDVVILTLSSAEVVDDRRAGVHANAELFRAVVKPLALASPDAIFIVVTNPVDVMTQLTQDLSGLPLERVLGSGTLLDTLRFRALLADRCNVHPLDIRAYVLGEHGDSQVAAISSASVGGAPLGIPLEEVHLLAEEAKDAGMRVMRHKGYTNFAVALSTMMIVEAVSKDTHEVLPVSTRLTDYCGVSGVCLSVPSVVGRKGVVRTLPIRLNAQETVAFQHSAEIIRKTLAAC
jgi:L-lactate dehydrogenase